MHMSNRIEANLERLGIELPAAPKPVASYVPWLISGLSLFISGQLCVGPDGQLSPAHQGKLGGSVSLKDGQAAARLCAINVLAQVKSAVNGDFDRICRCVKITGYVNCTPTFRDLPQVMNGASDLLAEVFEDAGLHVRSTVGVAQLPLNCAVEIEGHFALHDHKMNVLRYSLF